MEMKIIMPLVSIGMPLYNAAKTLRPALDSILAQDYINFELIISDNASRDETAEICKEFASRDRRIVYYRNERNMGGTWNFNHVVKLSKGKYFMRMSHDDIRAPTYLSKCVALLESNEQAVLCHSYTAAFYGDINNVLSIITHDSLVGIRSPWKRFIEALKHLPGSAIDGLFRTETLKTKTRLLENYISSDIVLTHEISLYGEFVQVPEVLFWRSGKAVLPPPQEIYPLFDMDGKTSKKYYPFLTVAANHASSIFRSPLSISSKLSLLIFVIYHEIQTVTIKALFRSVTALMGANCPGFLIRGAISIVNNNPNINMLKNPLEIPPALQPTWPLLNHRKLKEAVSLQYLLVEKLFKKVKLRRKMQSGISHKNDQ